MGPSQQKLGEKCGLDLNKGYRVKIAPMAKVKLTRHLYTFFPDLEGKDVVVEASTVADVVREMEKLAPGFAFYVCDELGRLRRHVNIFIEEERIADRRHLSDRVEPEARVFIMQALSGG
jgi:molybdopterin synthase sulfur carrier subunit